MLTSLFLFLITGVTLSLLLWTGFELFRAREDPLGDRLEELQSHALVNTSRVARRKSGGTLFDRLLYLVSMVPAGEDWLRGSEKLLRQAGMRRRNSLALYVLITVLLLLILVGAMAALQRNNPPSSWIGAMAAVLIIGFMLPRMVLQRMVKRYRRKLQEALPDTVDLLGIVLGTGLALDQAMSRVSDEMQFLYPELANEFATVVMQVRAGQERAKAFEQLVRRTGVEDIKSLAAMIVQSEKFGTSLSQALSVYADALRTRRRLRAEAAVGKAGVKMLFPIVIFILPVLFVITLVPAIINTLRDLKLLTAGR
ncbi:MAG: type II secretion system F family protein [Bryobacteraceae bacterium]|jgi:tight adherence protein C